MLKIDKTKCPITASLTKFGKRSSNSDDSMTHKTESSISLGDEVYDSSHMNHQEHDCVEALKDFCLENDIPFSDHTIFRFACFHGFKFDKAKEAIDENQNNTYLDLTMQKGLSHQFSTKTLFPLPGLKTKRTDSEVLYVRPARYFPETLDITKVIESLCYVLNDMSDTHEKCRNGVVLISNLKGFTEENFKFDQWFQFMQVMQGNLVPTRVNAMLVVNAPSWFEKTIWKQMKGSMSTSFAKKVHIMKVDKLGHYLMDGYKAYLPTELAHGYRDTQEIIEDYVDLKAFEDSNR